MGEDDAHYLLNYNQVPKRGRKKVKFIMNSLRNEPEGEATKYCTRTSDDVPLLVQKNSSAATPVTKTRYYRTNYIAGDIKFSWNNYKRLDVFLKLSSVVVRRLLYHYAQQCHDELERLSRWREMVPLILLCTTNLLISGKLIMYAGEIKL